MLHDAEIKRFFFHFSVQKFKMFVCIFVNFSFANFVSNVVIFVYQMKNIDRVHQESEDVTCAQF